MLKIDNIKLFQKKIGVMSVFRLTEKSKPNYITLAVAKSTAEPRNSNDLSLANNSAPCAFFIRSLRTSKTRPACSSMVACSGKGFALCCVPVIAVFEPVTRYRPSLETLRGNSLKLFTGVHAMKQFIFAAIRRTDLTNRLFKIRINAESENDARAQLAREFVLVLIGRINPQNHPKFNRTFSNQGLQTLPNKASIAGTTTYDGNRNRYSSGIFLPQIHTNNTACNGLACSFIEFAVRATRRNKALRTNNAGCSYAAVEPLSHPIKGDISLLTKHTRQSKMKTPQKSTALCAETAFNASSSRLAGVVYA